ncbi:MAG: hypothetical protein JRN21_05110 [Nitrososphaerota archaeon]|nr:hypothetical protein [Nitrososphaerota archaeon]
MVLFLAAVVATASATVSVFFYTNGSATVRTPDVQLVVGGDISGSCTAYPCASGSVSSTFDVMTATLSLFPASTGASPVPATYYSNFTEVKNTSPSAAHSIKSVQVLNIAGTTADLGSITIYYCTTQTEFTAAGALVTPANCVGSFAITSSTLSGGSVSGTFPQSIASGATQYIEIAAYAASGASASSSVTFQIAVQWA